MIQPSTLDFLKKLKKNNNRDWFEKNKNAYKEAQADVEQCVTAIIAGIRSFDKRVDSSLEAKKCLFRIYRDTRFSNNKTPYKTNMGASINPGGRMAAVPGYYLHIEPSGCFLAGGMYQPPPPELLKIRQEIDYNQAEFRKLLAGKEFKKYFDGLDTIEKLKTTPKGFPKDHPALDLLQHKHFIVSHTLKDAELSAKTFNKHATAVFKAMHPLALFLQRAID